MSFLENNKHQREKNKDVVVTSRLPKEVFDKFKAICDSADYSVSEAIRALVINEVSPKKITTPTRTRKEVRPLVPESVSDIESPIAPSDIPQSSDDVIEDNVNRVFNPTTKFNMGKFTTNRWKHNSLLPCPICNEWVSASNFSRHAKITHDSTTKDIFLTHTEEADAMVEAVKN